MPDSPRMYWETGIGTKSKSCALQAKWSSGWKPRQRWWGFSLLGPPSGWPRSATFHRLDFGWFWT